MERTRAWRQICKWRMKGYLDRSAICLSPVPWTVVKARICEHGPRVRGGIFSAVLLLVFLAAFFPSSVPGQLVLTNEFPSGPALSPELQDLRKRANGGDAAAQCQLGMAYADGNGVAQNQAAAANWFRKAAEQGDATAELRMGNCYLDGKGVGKDVDEAIKWFAKAAGHELAPPGNSTPALGNGTVLAKITTLEGKTYENATVVRVQPDGLLISYSSRRQGFGIALIPFANLSDNLQKASGYDPQVEANYQIQKQAREQLAFAEATRSVATQQARQSQTVATLLDIVAQYHKSHTYLTNEVGDNIYVCGDMACDVWDMVLAKGIHAKIVVGDIDEDITSIAQANHAWVLAEVSEGEWMALEATAGYGIRRNQNRRYFYGCRFSTAREYRDFEHLKRQFNETLAKGRAVEDNYNKLASAYNNADENGRTALKGPLQQQAAILRERVSDLRQLKEELDKLRLTED